MNPSNLFVGRAVGLVAVLVIAGVAWGLTREAPLSVTNFEECEAAGNPIMESYPRQCRHGDRTFVEDILPPVQACTQEAKLCPDGSAVGRVGPNCEFAQCPATSPSPVGRQCTGPSDVSCPTDFQCIQGCGPPVASQDDPPTPYFCQLKGYIRTCPICLAKDTLIDTPRGMMRVQDIQKGAPVWTVTASGKRTLAVVVETSQTPVPSTHIMVTLVLDDGRAVLASPGHPTVDGRTVGDIIAGEVYDGARVVTANRVVYSEGYTYDILTSGETGSYFAGGILLDSTLR